MSSIASSSTMDIDLPDRPNSAPNLINATSDILRSVTVQEIEELWLPIITDLSSLGVAVDELDHQFDRFIVNPDRRSNVISHQFRYKAALTNWFHLSVPASKLDLLHQLSYYWTDTPAGRAWMHLCTKQIVMLRGYLVDVVRERTERASRMVVDMQRRVDRKFTNMAQMSLLNPGWRNSEKDRFFGPAGPVVPIAREMSPEEEDEIL